MTALRTILCLAILHGLLLGPVAAADLRPRTDGSGDPLPDRAITRLGTTRWQLRDSPTGLAYSPDGKLFAAVSYEGPVVVWSVPSGKKLQEFNVGRSSSARMVFSNNGSRLAYSSGLENHIWDTHSGEELPLPAGVKTSLWVAAFAPDGKSIAGASLSGELHLWSLDGGKEVQAFEKVKGRVIALSFPERENLLAAATDGKSLSVWDALQGKRLHELAPPRDSPLPLAISPDGKAFAFPAEPNVVSIRSITDGKELHRLMGHTGDTYCLSFSADGNSLAVASRDATVRVWNMATGQERGQCRITSGGLPIVALSPDGKTAATGGPNNPHAVLFWDTAAGRINGPPGHKGPIACLAYSPDGKQVATASWLRGEAEVRLWEAATGRLLREFAAHQGGVSAVAFSPDGKTLASGGWRDRTVRVWDVATTKEVHAFKGHEAGVTCLAFSPDGERLVSGDAYCNAMGQYQGRVRVWDLATGKCAKVLCDHLGAVQAVAFDPTAAMVVVAADGVHSYDVASSHRVGEPLRPKTRVWSLAFSPDRKVLLTTAGNQPVQLWESATGQSILSLSLGWRVRAALSPDGRFLAIGTEKGVRLFDRVDNTECLTLHGTHGAVGALAFSPDGRLLAGAGTEDTSALLWDVAAVVRRPLPAASKADAETLDRWWAALAGANAPAADRAAWDLIRRPGQAVPRLKEWLKPAKLSDRKRVAKLIADLNADDFEARERASRELEQMGEGVAGQLRDALKSNPTA